MPFDWRDFLVLAHELRNDPREAAQRASLGRAYYYIYNLALAYARAMNFSGTMPGLHAKLWKWCRLHEDPNIKKIGINGERMLSLRHDADYIAAAIPNLASEVKVQLDRAQEIERLVAQTTGQSLPQPLA